MTAFTIFWGHILRELRTKNHLHQGDVAELLHISRQNYSHLETGKVRPTPEIISILTEVYQTDLFDYARKCQPENLLREQTEFKSVLESAKLAYEDNNKKRSTKNEPLNDDSEPLSSDD